MGLDVTLFSTTSTSSLDVVAATSGKSAIVRSTSTLSVLTKFGAMSGGGGAVPRWRQQVDWMNHEPLLSRWLNLVRWVFSVM